MSFFRNIKDSVTNSVVDTVDDAKSYLQNTDAKEIAKDTAVLAGKAALAVGKVGFFIGKEVVTNIVNEGKETRRQEEKTKEKAKRDALEKVAREKEWEERKANRQPSDFELGLKKKLEDAKKKQFDREKK
ncbi:hypothetical protein BST50_21910 [Vibrio vulnificus]|uniref:hypothetical protein n=1 Tax=Vibrio vulnificus TaxID=672 RepID=UPI000BA8772B|nr:hypothetical protein [Vibrio vulnificus]EGR0671405.1 hypothetical protein [Vibrio vulnificus]MCG9655630.1 hypothetical protein [Vibrio vulnificus]PAO29829.1 hypothetical protein BST49_21685 [Vibrio vulnificus]PAO37337.1 hypothetical protein BST50_21910 [Vibrio vulnificus]PAO41983.1 hypothetical protein BST53_21800 [Vibrio vulnificus]